MNHPALTSTIAAVLARAPEWIRHDLAVKQESIRTRAEDALAAMIAAAIAGEASGSGS